MLASAAVLESLRKDLVAKQGEMVRLLRRFVRVESFSDDKRGVDRLGRTVAREWRRRGGRVTFLRQPRRGNHLRIEIPSPRGGRGQILILGHLDTVYPPGTLALMPFRVSRGRAWGPGALDMKAGLVIALFAVEALLRAHLQPGKRLVFLWTSDEEMGSETSRPAIEREARRSNAVLVLEPGFGPRGLLKTQRKGVGTIEISVRGRAAHAGVNPENGINAIDEMMTQIEKLKSFARASRGITIQPNVVAGGTFPNVVAERAEAKLDVRVARLADVRRLDRALRSLKPIQPGARLYVRGGVSRPPLERTAGVASLFHKAQLVAKEIGVALGETSTGGGSDGNFTSALGVPTLDGLGAVGDGAHSKREHIIHRRLPERAALLAGLLLQL